MKNSESNLEHGNASFIHCERSSEFKPNFKQISDISIMLKNFDKERGWPPRSHSDCEIEITPSFLDMVTPSLKVFQKATKHVLRSKKIMEMLGKDWIHLITQHVTQTNIKREENSTVNDFEFRMLFYSYTSNQTIEVQLKGKDKMSINILTDIYIPESFQEIQNAIEIAKADERLLRYVDKLDANAMLEPLTDISHNSFKNRIMRVMFTEKYDKFKELPVLFCALVDLNNKSVLYAGEAPCIQKS